MIKDHIKVGTLNVRGLLKTIPPHITRNANPSTPTTIHTTSTPPPSSINSLTSPPLTTTHSAYLKYLHQHRLDVACFQETHLKENHSTDYIENRLHAHQGCWTEYCAILNMNDSLHLSPQLITIDKRCIYATLTHADWIQPMHIV